MDSQTSSPSQACMKVPISTHRQLAMFSKTAQDKEVEVTHRILHQEGHRTAENRRDLARVSLCILRVVFIAVVVRTASTETSTTS